MRLTLLALGMVAVALLSGLLGVGQRYLSAIVGEGVIYDLRVALYGHLQHMSLRFFTHTKTGELMFAAEQRRRRRPAGGHRNFCGPGDERCVVGPRPGDYAAAGVAADAAGRGSAPALSDPGARPGPARPRRSTSR